MTISEREIGELQQRVLALEHRHRNDRAIVQLIDGELDALRADLERLRSRIYGIASSIAVFAALVAWVLEFVAR